MANLRDWGLIAAVLATACASNPVEPAALSPPPLSQLAIPVAGANPAPVVAPASPVNDTIGDLIANRGADAAASASAPAPAAALAGAPMTLERYLADLSAVSCPKGTKQEAPETISLKADPVPLQGLNPSRKTVGQLTFVAGFHLTSTDDRFGGLSGVDILDDGNLLTVSDLGRFVWLDLGRDGVTPVAARLAPLRDAKGDVLKDKVNADSEGLAIHGGMALVSFERNHRVLAYDIGDCGAAARGAPIVMDGLGEPMPQAFADAKIAVDDNTSLEALAVTPDWYVFSGLETKVGDASPLSARPIEAAPDFNLRIGEKAPEFVGLDLLTSKDGQKVRAFDLHRSFSPLSGNAITINETDFERYLDQSNLPARVVSELDERAHYRYRKTGARTLAELNILLTIDNFEGIAAKEMPDGRVRLFVISDDNFSASQRTLLMIFDVK
jgi:hypothetical protein